MGERTVLVTAPLGNVAVTPTTRLYTTDGVSFVEQRRHRGGTDVEKRVRGKFWFGYVKLKTPLDTSEKMQRMQLD